MDDTQYSSDDSRVAMSRPYRSPLPATPRPDAFRPLRLLLVPTGMSVDLTKRDQLLGRHSTADVRLPLADVSRRHCRVLFTDAAWTIIDLDSLNGVFVNNLRVRQAVLSHGDRIRIGSFIFEVRLNEAASVQQSVRDTRQAS